MGVLLESLTRSRFLLVLLTLALLATTFPRPVLGATPDFTISANSDNIDVLTGYWVESILTFKSVNGLTGNVQLETSVGPDTGLVGAGFSTGMQLTPDGQVSTDLQLTAGSVPGNYNLTLTATIGQLSHSIRLPVTVSSSFSQDFITRLWGSYSTLQDRNITIQEQLVSLNGFEGQITLGATVTPGVDDAPAISFQPSIVTLSPNGEAGYNASVSASRTTPTGNYIVTVSALSGMISHSYQAILMVGDYRPPLQEPPPNSNATTTSRPQSAGNTFIRSMPVFAPSTVSVLSSYWWQLTIVGFCIAGIMIRQKKT